MIPTIARIVLYCLRESDAEAINRRRKDARDQEEWHRSSRTGAQVHVGNDVKGSDVFPMVIVRVWGTEPTSPVNGHVLLDGNDTFWATSVACGEGPGTFSWPVKV